MPAQLLGQAKQESKEPENLEYDAAFMVLIRNGQVVFEPDINKPVTVKRQPTSHEIKGALAVIAQDIVTQETAFQVLTMQEARVRAMMEAQQNQQLLAQINQSR